MRFRNVTAERVSYPPRKVSGVHLCGEVIRMREVALSFRCRQVAALRLLPYSAIPHTSQDLPARHIH